MLAFVACIQNGTEHRMPIDAAGKGLRGGCGGDRPALAADYGSFFFSP